MTSPHVPSDDTAITSAHERVWETQQASVRERAEAFIARPVRWTWEALRTAAIALEAEYIARLERERGVRPGQWGGISHAYGPGQMPEGLREAGCEPSGMSDVELKPGWLERQFAAAQEILDTLPPQLRDQTPGRRHAADKLRRDCGAESAPPAADVPAAGVSQPAEGRGAFSNVPIDDAMARAEAMFSGQPVRLVPRHGSKP